VADAEVLADLLAQVRTEDEAVQRLLDEVASEAGIGLEIGKDPGPQLLDKAEELQEKWQVAPGDVWQCGDLWLICGDCREADTWERLLSVAGVTKVHGVFTSPPYAEQRKKQYNGIATDKYVDWWEPVQENVRRYLADDGSFFVNLKAHCEDGERVLYVMDLVLAMKRRWGWRWVDEFIWRHSGFPGGWRNRFKNEFEPIFHFDREGHSLYVQIISEENAAEILNEPIDDVGSIHHFSILRRIKFYPRCVGKKSNEAFDYSPNNAKLWGTGNVGLGGPGLIRKTGIARPGNFVNIEYSQGRGTSHAAVFPVALPAFFIRAFSEKGDVWCDNFSGSGTTGVAAFQHGRRFIGIELVDRYCAVTLERWHQMTGGEPRLLECSSFSAGGG